MRSAKGSMFGFAMIMRLDRLMTGFPLSVTALQSATVRCTSLTKGMLLKKKKKLKKKKVAGMTHPTYK